MLQNNKIYVELSGISRWKFIKTLILDVILQNVFLFLNIGIGVLLLKQYKYSDQIMMYIILLLFLPWLPALILIPGGYMKIYNKSDRVSLIWSVISGLTLMIVFPILPTFIHISILFGKKIEESLSTQNQIFYNIKSILHTNIFNIIIIFLIIRGKINFDNGACFVDELGRSACMIYPVICCCVFAICIEIMSAQELQERKISDIPILLITTIFQTVVFSCSICYLDYWSCIPGFLSLFLITCGGIYFKREDTHLKNDEVDTVQGVTWNGMEWIFLEQNIGIGDTSNYEENL